MMRVFLRALLICCVAASTARAGVPIFQPSRMTIGGKIYELSWTKEELEHVKWDYQSADLPPVTPKAALAKARAALVELRPAEEIWKLSDFELDLTGPGSYYNVTFHLDMTATSNANGLLEFLVLMDGRVLAPKLVPK